MKKITFILVCMFAMCATTLCADNKKTIKVNQLPVAAQKFVTQHFKNRKIALAKMETEFMSKSYEVIFSNGDYIDFDSKGNWEEIECKTSSVPTTAVPAKIMQYIRKNYPNAKVKKIEKGRREYEVKLSNGIELSFDLQFNLTDIDR